MMDYLMAYIIGV